MNNRLFLPLFCLVLISCEKSPELPRNDQPWIKTNGPILTRGPYPTYDFYAMSDCWVLRDGGTYKMWYTSGGAVLPDTVLRSRISYATSADGIHWEKYGGNPVMDVSKTAWDSMGVETVSVLIDESANVAERYKMWYAGQTFNDYRYEIGYAVSNDGIHWSKHQEPVLRVGKAAEWDNGFLEGPSVVRENGVYKMWYAGYDVSIDGKATDGKVNIGLATSPDGIQWTKYSGNPVMTTSAGWDSETVQDPHVIRLDDGYHMWFGGVDKVDLNGQEIGYAFSKDGITWEKSKENPIVKKGLAGSWDGFIASFPSVLIEQNELKMWYTGKNALHPTWPEPYSWDIGFASQKK